MIVIAAKNDQNENNNPRNTANRVARVMNESTKANDLRTESMVRVRIQKNIDDSDQQVIVNHEEK